MPWCGYWGTAGGAFWWVLPLIGLILMGVMFFFVFVGGFGCMGGRRLLSGGGSDLQREVQGEDDVR